MTQKQANYQSYIKYLFMCHSHLYKPSTVCRNGMTSFKKLFNVIVNHIQKTITLQLVLHRQKTQILFHCYIECQVNELEDFNFVALSYVVVFLCLAVKKRVIQFIFFNFQRSPLFHREVNAFFLLKLSYLYNQLIIAILNKKQFCSYFKQCS